MELPLPKGNPSAPLNADVNETTINFQQSPSDENALALCLQDMERSEAFLLEKRWSLEWDRAALLYAAPGDVKFWPGTDHPRAHLSVPLVVTHLEAIAPQVMEGLFGNEPPFSFIPRPGTSDDAAMAHAAIIAYQLENINFKSAFEEGLRHMLLFGTGIWRWGWETHKEKRKTYRRKSEPIVLPSVAGTTVTVHPNTDEFEVEETEVEISQPTFEAIDTRHVFMDPNLAVGDIRKGRYVIYRDYLTANDLRRLRGLDGYKIPPDDTLRAIFFQPKEPTFASPVETVPIVIEQQFAPLPRWMPGSADPLEQPIEVLERWDHENVVVVLNRKVVIRNENHGFGCIPFLSCNYIDIPGSAYGFGLGKLVGGEQRLQQSIINARLDETSLNLMGTYVRKRGTNPAGQNINLRPGGILEDDDPQNFRALPRLPAVPEAYVEIEASEARAERLSGANELLVQGALPSRGRSSITRTATGVSALAGAAGARLQYLVNRLEHQVFVPFLYAVSQMNTQYLSPTEVSTILDKELGTAYKNDVMDIYNARIKFSVMAGAGMAQKRAMAQSLPILFEFLFQGPIPELLPQLGEKIDVNEAINMLFSATGWKTRPSLIVPMTPEDQQRMAAQSAPAAAIQKAAVTAKLAGQNKQAALATQHQNRMQQIEATTAGKAWLQAQDRVLREIEQHEMMEGDFGGVAGFGDQANQNLVQE
jgi:hypothetical protein